MFNLIIFPVIFFFLNTSPLLKLSTLNNNHSDTGKEIYLIKQYWHTAIVINKDDIDEKFLGELNIHVSSKLVDFGWGDEDFYQHPDFDSGLAFNALFYATHSTLRVESIIIPNKMYFGLSEIVIKLDVTENQIFQILNYIKNTLYRNNRNVEILSERGAGNIKFFRAKGDYHLFNTCNTWIADCLVNAGFGIENNVILTWQLFNEALKIGELVKVSEQ